ncbi:hypothetical protein [Nocardioides speluncae]|uniref:hypothetical protein n=1 Tax=Nocardioides speluncae TaxID=2670337 RepID=UPI000D69B95A|nr:hypothetical protein [Nocardioides speluncae]
MTTSLDDKLRRTLTAVADTVQAAEHALPAPSPARTGSRKRRRLLIGAGVTIAAIPLAAAAIIRSGSEYVDQIPPENPIISGSLDGERYWVVDGRDDPRCPGSPSGIELIAEAHNVVGQEWSTVGAVFGEQTADGCPSRQPADPPESTYFADGGLQIGDGMLWMGALHPDIDQVRVVLDDGEAFNAAIFEHEGGEYYVLEVPPGTETLTIDYLTDGDVVEPPTGDRHVVPIE